MPLPKSSMKACMSKVKKEFPEGRSDKKKGKKSAHKQHVAMCLNTVKESKTMIKSLIDGMTFSQFLITEAAAPKTYSIGSVVKAHPLFKEFFGTTVSKDVRDEKTGRGKAIDMVDPDEKAALIDEFRREIESGYPEIDFDRLTQKDIATLQPEIEAFLDMKNDQIHRHGSNIYRDDPTTAYDDMRAKEEDDYLDSMDRLNATMRSGASSRHQGASDWDSLVRGKTDRARQEMQAAKDEVRAMRANPDEYSRFDVNAPDASEKVAVAKAKAANMGKTGSAGRQSTSGVLYRIKNTGWFKQMNPEQQQAVIANIRSGMTGAEAKAAALRG